MKFFTQFNRPPNPSVFFKRPSLAEQYHKNDFDINRLIARATRSGVLATADQIREVYYGDFSEVDQALENHLRLVEAEEHFMSLPSKVREYFANDPKRLLKALSDPSQLGKLVDLGLVKAPQPVIGTQEVPLELNKPASDPNQPSLPNV